MGDIHPQRRPRFHVAQEVGAEHHSMTNLVLDPEVHLNCARGDVVGSKHCYWQVDSLTQLGSNIVGVGSRKTKRVSRLISLLKGKFGRGRLSDGVRAGTLTRALQRIGPHFQGVAGNGQWLAVKASEGGLEEGAG